MKVKCRGYEGELIDLSETMQAKTLSGEYRVYFYKLRIALKNTTLTLENVRNDEIEFIKEVRNNDRNNDSSLDIILVQYR